MPFEYMSAVQILYIFVNFLYQKYNINVNLV